MDLHAVGEVHLAAEVKKKRKYRVVAVKRIKIWLPLSLLYGLTALSSRHLIHITYVHQRELRAFCLCSNFPQVPLTSHCCVGYDTCGH